MASVKASDCALPDPLTLKKARTGASRTPARNHVSDTGCPDAGHLSPFIRTKNCRGDNALRVNPMPTVLPCGCRFR